MNGRERLFNVLTATAMLILAALSVSAQNPTVGPNEAIAFDYYDADFTAGEVTGFEVQWDADGWLSLGIPPAFSDAQTPAGALSYKVASPFTSGTHSVAFRACNLVGCGGASNPFRVRVSKRADGSAE